MKTKSCKAKGRRLQQFIAGEISKLLDIPCGKDTDIESRESSQSGEDVVLHGRAKELFKWSVECKNTETVNFWKSIEQAKSNQKEGTDWILVCKRNREDPVVTIDAKVFFDMLKRLKT